MTELMDSTRPEPVRHEVLLYLDRHQLLYGLSICLVTFATLSDMTVRSWREGLALGIAEGDVIVLNEQRQRVDPGSVDDRTLIIVVRNSQKVQRA